MKKNIATVISRIFDPFIMLSMFIVLAFIRGGVTSIPVWVSAFAMMIVIPVVLIVFAIKKHIVGNYDVSRRSERPLVLGVLIIIESLSIVVLSRFVSLWVIHTLLLVVATLLGFTIVTLRWKMSGHVLASALTTGSIVAWFGWAWWPVLLIVPLVGWARVVRKDHTIAQVIAGAAYSWIITSFL